MSTRSSHLHYAPQGEHKLHIHIYGEMHEGGTVEMIEFECSTCHCGYKFLMNWHLAEHLIEYLKKGLENKPDYEECG